MASAEHKAFQSGEHTPAQAAKRTASQAGLDDEGTVCKAGKTVGETRYGGVLRQVLAFFGVDPDDRLCHLAVLLQTAQGQESLKRTETYRHYLVPLLNWYLTDRNDFKEVSVVQAEQFLCLNGLATLVESSFFQHFTPDWLQRHAHEFQYFQDPVMALEYSSMKNNKAPNASEKELFQFGMYLRAYPTQDEWYEFLDRDWMEKKYEPPTRADFIGRLRDVLNCLSGDELIDWARFYHQVRQLALEFGSKYVAWTPSQVMAVLAGAKDFAQDDHCAYRIMEELADRVDWPVQVENDHEWESSDEE